MKPSGLLDEAIVAALPFPSLSTLRSVHNDLLKKQHVDGSSPELLAAAEDFVRRGRETGTLLDDTDDRWSAQSALDYWAAALYRFDRREIDSLLAEFNPELAPELDDALCPYVGLEAFRESQHDVFFGRSLLLADLTTRLATNRLVAVLGPSGSGKSSVVLGGLLPALKSGALPGSGEWYYPPPLVPGSEPLRNLARAFLLPGVEADAWLAAQSERLARDPEQHLARLVAERGGGAPTMLVVDQFEEIFTLCEDTAVRQAFVTGLLGLLRAEAPQHRVVLTMRSDYEAFITRLPELQPFWDTGQIRMTPLAAAELREAIEKPAERAGLKFEEGVVSALLEDLLGEPAGLPLLQFTLLKLWKKREKNRVTWAAYHRLGGGRKALATSAEELYDDLKVTQNQDTAKRILLRMVRPDAGLEFTSSRVRRASLDKIGDDPGRIAWVLDKLVEARLVRLTPGETPGDAQVEVAHEALVRNWPRLVEWLQEARSKMATCRRLEARAADWVRLGRGHGGLLDEVQLAEAEAWLAGPEAAELGHDEQLTALVQASREVVDREARGRRWKKALLWALPLLLLAYLLAWVAFLRALDRANLAQALDDKSRIEQQLKAAEEQIRQARERVQSATLAADAAQRRAGEELRQAEEKIRSAEKDRQAAARIVAVADERVRKANEREKEANKQATEAIEKAKIEEIAARHQLEVAEQALSDARVKQSEAIKIREQVTQIEQQVAELEKRSQNAEQRWKGLERELVDGGDERKNPTIPTLLKRIRNTVHERVELRQFRKRQRPVLAGTSARSYDKKSLTGTICCLVRDAQGEYLLSRASVFAGSPGTPILQPSRDDSPLAHAQNIVANVVRVGGSENRKAAIARLGRGIAISPNILQVGPIEGIAEGLEAGAEVWLVGRGSGLRKGKIRRIDDDGTIITDIRPSPGDTGGPLVTPDRRLIGMLWGWSGAGRESYVAPIKPILDELKVELVTAR